MQIYLHAKSPYGWKPIHSWKSLGSSPRTTDLNPRETAATALPLDRSRTAQTPTKAKSAFAKIRVVFVKYSRSQTKQLIRIGLGFVRSAFIFRFVIYYFYNPTLKSNEIQADFGYTLASLVAQRVKRLPAVQETRVQALGQGDPLEKEMATHSSFLTWRIPWTENPGGLQSTGSQTEQLHFHFWFQTITIERIL